MSEYKNGKRSRISGWNKKRTANRKESIKAKGKRKISAGVILIAMICILLPVAAYFSEETDSGTVEETLERGDVGSGDVEYHLILNAEGLPEDYDYTLSVAAQLLTQEEIEEYFAQAREEIESSFYADGENADHATVSVYPQDTYANDLVTADWLFSDYEVIDTDGTFHEDNLSEEGTIIEAEVTLTCQDATDIYDFTFAAWPAQLTAGERLLKSISQAITTEAQKTGTDVLTLPSEADGVSLHWSSQKEYLTVKVIFFEIVILVLVYFTEAERRKEKEEKRKKDIELDYSEIVSKLSILMGSGMSLKSAWKIIVSRYEQDLKNGSAQRPAYEEMMITMHQIESGVTESNAYQKFGERTGVHSFLRLSRILLQSQQKGSQNLCEMLEKESVNAFDERKLRARKQGEEAGTKMLLPMMIMMGIVIAVVIAPAMVSFGG